MKELLRELLLIIEDNISDSKEKYEIYQQFISYLSDTDGEILDYLSDVNDDFSEVYQEHLSQLEIEEE